MPLKREMEEEETGLVEGLNHGDEEQLLSECEYNVHRMIKTARLVIKGVGLPKNKWIWGTYPKGVEVTFLVDPGLTGDVCLWIDFEGEMVVGLWDEGEDGDSAQKLGTEWKEAVAKIKDLLEIGRLEKRKEGEEEETPRKSPKVEEEV